MIVHRPTVWSHYRFLVQRGRISAGGCIEPSDRFDLKTTYEMSLRSTVVPRGRYVSHYDLNPIFQGVLTEFIRNWPSERLCLLWANVSADPKAEIVNHHWHLTSFEALKFFEEAYQ